MQTLSYLPNPRHLKTSQNKNGHNFYAFIHMAIENLYYIYEKILKKSQKKKIFRVCSLTVKFKGVFLTGLIKSKPLSWLFYLEGKQVGTTINTWPSRKSVNGEE